jgi:hypothetical protein
MANFTLWLGRADNGWIDAPNLVTVTGTLPTIAGLA